MPINLAGRARESAELMPPRKGRRLSGEMTRTERLFADLLVIRQAEGKILGWQYEPEVLVLSARCDCSYTPDFKVLLIEGGYIWYEIKGRHAWQDSIIKLKWAADKFWPIPFFLASYRGQGTGWAVRHMGVDRCARRGLGRMPAGMVDKDSVNRYNN